MQTACKQIRLWQQQYERQDLKISVNLSAKQFYASNLYEDIKTVLTETGLRGENLKLEITESLFINDFQEVISLLGELSKLGIQFSIDDFGTGYSSLSYLQNLPAHTLKLDRAFVSHINQDKNQAIANAVIVLGQMMGMNIIAEGIETQEQVDILRSLDCEYGQGFFFEKPLCTGDGGKYLAGFPSVLNRAKKILTF